MFEKGTFFTGCNYWASHAGLNMWHEWDAETIDSDLKRLSEHGVNVLRIFPLWSDFQPLRMHTVGGQTPNQVRMGEDVLPETEAGRAGVSEIMLERFRYFLDTAEKYGHRLIVGLVTGWMSGRMFVPEMLQGRNVITDPLAIKWQIKYVRHMVRTFKGHPAIAAWDLGNECNCMGEAPTREAFYCWMASISMAIRVEDDTRPVISGMHGVRIEGKAAPRDQGELTDVLTTHPYPLFTPHCGTDPINRMKSALHAAAESRYYADLSGKPCFAEEVGCLGPMIASDEVAADYSTASMFTLWAHDCHGFVWWCAYEQLLLTSTPYDWDAVERELGLFYLDMTPKPIVGAMKRFKDFAGGVGKLPENIADAVCVLTKGQDTWAAAYGAFILAKKAHMDIRFADAEFPVPEADVYMLPSVKGTASIPRRTYMDIIERVKNGATLYMSLDDCLLSPFDKVTGVRVLTRYEAISADTVEFAGEKFVMDAPRRICTESVGAEVLARNEKGDIVFSAYKLGKGIVYCLNYPIEYQAAVRPAVTDGENAQPFEKFYRAMGLRSENRAADISLATMGLTEHIVSENERLLVIINYEPYAQTGTIALKDGWRIESVHSIDSAASINGCDITIPNNNGAAIRIVR